MVLPPFERYPRQGGEEPRGRRGKVFGEVPHPLDTQGARALGEPGGQRVAEPRRTVYHRRRGEEERFGIDGGLGIPPVVAQGDAEGLPLAPECGEQELLGPGGELIGVRVGHSTPPSRPA